MSVVNAMRSQKKKEEEEQQKQVVGQQQKTQSNASKPTGSTSIPKDNQGISRTQKSAASSLRTENNVTTSRRSDNTSVNRNTVTANISEQRQTRQQMSDRRGSQRRENFNPLSENRTTTSNLPGPDMLPKLAEQRRNNTQNAQNTQNPQNIPDNLLKEYASKNGISYEEARKRFDDASNMRNQTITKPGQINEDASAKARADRAEEIRKANQRQQSAFEAGLTNMGKTLADPVNLLPFAVGKLTGQNYDLVGERAREAERQATEQHPVASALGDIAGFLVGNKILRGGKATENALNAGEVLKTARDDALLNGATKGQALLNGISNAARTTGVNALKDYARTDLALDTLPSVMNSIIEGKSREEVARDAALNVGANVGFNAIGDILSAGKALNDVRRSANNAAIDEIAQNAARQSEEAARNMNNLAQTIPDVSEEVLRSATDSPYRNAEQIISPADTNKALGNNEYQYIKEQAIKRLTDLGGDENQQLYANLVRSADEDNLNAFNRALSDYREATGGRFDRQLNRLEDAVNGRVPKDVPEALYSDINTNIDSIEDGLNHIGNLEGLSDLGQTHLANARTLLDQYEDAVRNGGDVQGIAADLNRALGNLNNQAKKVDEYNKVFNQWRGGDNPRGNLFSNSGKVINTDSLSPEDEAMIRDWISKEGDPYARPANQPEVRNTIPSVDDLPTELPEANVPESGNFLDDFARSQNETPAAPVSNENVLPPTQEANVVSNEGDRVVSQARTNVFERSGIDEAESKNIYTPEDYTYVKETNAGQLDNATSWLNELGNDAVPYYANKDFSKDKATIRDVDSMMMLTERLRNQARETTDAVEKARLYAESKDLSIKSVQAASQFGKDLQSWSKWADTPERVIDKGYGVMLNRVEDFFKSNPKAKWGISDVSKNIEELFKQNNIAEVMASGDKKAIADLKREISNGIDEIIKGANKQTRKALEGMSEADIEQLMYENSMKGINQALEMFAGTGSMGLKDSTIDKIFEIMAKNEGLNAHSKEFVQNEKKMYSLIANDISKGGTFGQKFDTWRYVSMLSNPSTHLRNLTGNITMQGVSGVKNNVAAIIEAAADRASKGGIDRTKGLLNPFKDGDLITASNNDALEHAYRELSGHRYSGMAKGIESEAKAFKNKGVGKAINKLSDINSGALSAEDEFFKVREYSTALAGYLKGNGFDASIFDDGLSRENAAKLEKIFSKGQRSRIGIDTPEAMREQFLQDARAYAINKANVQTFNNTNVIANKISQVTQDLRNSDRKDAKAFGYALDVTVPFKNVPANVLNTAIAYSPAEWVKVLSDTNKLVKGSMSAAEYIDEIATATTGTLGMMLGGYLAHEGILHIGAEKGKRERAYDKATDNMNNAISIGGHSMDLTQLIPAAAPLIFGATVYDVLSSKGNGLSAIDTMTSGLSALADGVTDMTMLSGLADILQTNKYSDESIWGSIATKVTQNAANQLVPTVGGKIEKVFDDTQRNSWYTGKEGIADKVEQTARYNISKIPGAQNLGERLKGSDNKTLSNIGDLLALQPRIDSKGEAMQNKGENAVGRLANAVLPLELGNDRSTETDNKLRELASTLPAGEERDKLFPYAKQSEAKFNNSSDEQIQLTPDQWTQYQQNKGQMTTDMLDKFLNGNIYESLDNATRTSTITNMYDFATKYNQNKIADGAMSKDMQALADIYDKEGSEGVIKYLAGKGIAEAAGVRGNAYAAKDIAESTAEGDIEEAYKKADIVSQLADHGLTDKYSYEGFQQASTVIPNLSVDDYAKTLETINEDDKPNIKQEELAHYLNKQKVTSESEAKRITEAYGKDTWKAEPKLVDGEWTFKKPKKEKGSTKSKESKTELTPTGNNNMDTLLKAKQKAREDAKSNNPPGAEDLPEAKSAQETSSGGLNWALNNGYDLQSTQTYSRAKAAGVSDADFNTAWWAADADGNGYMKKAEAWNYASQFPTKEEQQKWFHILYKGR